MIVIKTMTELPEHCWECPCHDGESGYCQADKEHRYSDYRPFWCPLSEIDTTEETNKTAKIEAFIKENFEPVEDKPGYVWFSKRHIQMISIETLRKELEREGAIPFTLRGEEVQNET